MAGPDRNLGFLSARCRLTATFASSNAAAARAPRPAAPGAACTELLASLTDWLALLRQLVALTTRKLAALRTADSSALEQLAAEEGERVRDLLARSASRAAVLARVAQSLPGGPPPRLTLTALADGLAEPTASVLRARIAALREAATELQRKNAVVAQVAQNLQGHIRSVFTELAKATQECVVYGAGGQPEASSRRCWVDAVG